MGKPPNTSGAASGRLPRPSDRGNRHFEESENQARTSSKQANTQPADRLFSLRLDEVSLLTHIKEERGAET
jgi:hypothetical protein